LDFRQPSKPGVDSSRKVEEQERDERKAQRCGDDSDFSQHNLFC
jgi:hypothetical protein